MDAIPHRAMSSDDDGADAAGTRRKDRTARGGLRHTANSPLTLSQTFESRGRIPSPPRNNRRTPLFMTIHTPIFPSATWRDGAGGF